MKSLFQFALMFLLFASPLFAITDEEIFRAFSLNLSTPGARAVGMGAAFIGRADDATAAETNPAGLTNLARPEVSVEYSHSNDRNATTSALNIPITNLDLTPSAGFVAFDQSPGTSNFSATDTLTGQNTLGFASFVYPRRKWTFAFSRHELINTEATLSGTASASPFHFLEDNSFSGTSNIQDTNYTFTASTRVTTNISVGGSLKISAFTFESDIGARQKTEPQFGEHFRSIINSTDHKVGFNGGVLIRATPKVSIGAVYKYEPSFDLDATINNTDFSSNPLIVERIGVNKVQFNVPDSFGVGVSGTPTQNLTINFDVVRVFWSQLENVDTGFSLFTHLLPKVDDANQITFKIDDGTDVHLGAEYLILQQNNVFAVRGGFYVQSPNRFFLGTAANADVATFLSPIFGTDSGNSIKHITFGGGVTHGNFQVDAAFDFSRDDDESIGGSTQLREGGIDIILSSVLRF